MNMNMNDNNMLSLYLLPLITSVIILSYLGAYPGQKVSINPQNRWRMLIIVIYYIQWIMMALGILCGLVISIMLPHVWYIPRMGWTGFIVTCFLAFYIVDLWIHISYFGWNFSSGDIHSYHQGWKVLWIIVMAWITILAFIFQTGNIVLSSWNTKKIKLRQN